jgi:hypothetical protein
MSEVPDCPYCGNKVHTDRVMDYDSKVKLRCNNCGGFFEYMPGFGAFTLPELERRGSVRHEGFFRPHYEDEVPWETDTQPTQQSNCGNCCGVAVCLCCVLPIIMFIFSIILGFGWLWFWFW